MRKSNLLKKITVFALCTSLMLGTVVSPTATMHVNATEVEEQIENNQSETTTDIETEVTTSVEDIDETNLDIAPSIEIQEDGLVTEDELTDTSIILDEDANQDELVAESRAGEGSFDISKAFQIVTLINNQRAAVGAKDISMDLGLYQTAQVRAKEIVEKFSHTRPDGTGCFTAFPAVQVSMGENLAQGYSSASAVMNAWMADAQHKNTIINSRYMAVGVACYYLPGSKYGYYWVQCFGDKVDCDIYQDGDGYTSNTNTMYNGVDYAAVFNASYYLKTYPDIGKELGNNADKALEHFVKIGMAAGYQGCADFNVRYYMNRYVDLRNMFANNKKLFYLHYIRFGKAEGRDGKTPCTSQIGTVTIYKEIDYSAVYDYDYYMEHNPDLKEKFKNKDVNALMYFINTGMAKGDQACETFDVDSYANKYYSLRKKYKNDLRKYYMDYIEHGKDAGKIATGVPYLQGGTTVYGTKDYKDVYKLGYYDKYNPDLKKSFGYDDDKYMNHFIKYGMKEARRAHVEFDPLKYKARYKDISVKYGTDYKKYYQHYMNVGKASGRIGN